MSSGSGPRGELADGGLQPSASGMGALRVVATGASARLPALIEDCRDQHATRDGRLRAVSRGPRYSPGKAGDDQRVDRSVSHHRFEPSHLRLKLRDPGDQRFEFGDAGAQGLHLRALALPMLAGSVGRVPLLPGGAGGGCFVMVDVGRRDHGRH